MTTTRKTRGDDIQAAVGNYQASDEPCQENTETKIKKTLH